MSEQYYREVAEKLEQRAEAAEQTIHQIAKAIGMIEHGDCHSIQAEDEEIVEAVQQLRAWQYEHAQCAERAADEAERVPRWVSELAERWIDNASKDYVQREGDDACFEECAHELLAAAKAGAR